MTLPVGQLAVRPYQLHTPTGSSATYPSTPQSAETLCATTPSSPSPSPTPTPQNGTRAVRSSFLLQLKRNSAADLLDSVEWMTDTFSSLRTQLRDRDAELALTRDYVAYLEHVVEERDERIRALEQQARRDARMIQKHREGLGIAWSAMMPREAQRRFQQDAGGQGGQGALRVQGSWNGQIQARPTNMGQAL